MPHPLPTLGPTQAKFKGTMARLPTALGDVAKLAARGRYGTSANPSRLIVERDQVLAGIGKLREHLRIANERMDKLGAALARIGRAEFETEERLRHHKVGGL